MNKFIAIVALSLVAIISGCKEEAKTESPRV